MFIEPKGDVLLYVEDEILIQAATTFALEDAGFKVLAAHSGAEALNIIATEQGPIDGLVTDINLGDGPDGWNVARRARERMPHMAVVYASSVGEDEWKARGVPHSELCAKHCEPSLVAGTMSKLIAGSARLLRRRNVLKTGEGWTGGMHERDRKTAAHSR